MTGGGVGFFFLADVFQSPTSTLQKDESIVRVLVRIPNQQVFNEVCPTTTGALDLTYSL